MRGAGPYRDEIDALRERRAVVAREIEALSAHGAALAHARARERELGREMAALEGRLAGVRARRPLPMLDRVAVASPCAAAWADMAGDDRVRSCLTCSRNVYDLSAMTRDEAEALVRTKDGELCVRFYERPDGTIMTSDCPVGAASKRRRQAAFGIAALGAMALSGAAAALAVGARAIAMRPAARESSARTAEVPVDRADPNVRGGPPKRTVRMGRLVVTNLR